MMVERWIHMVFGPLTVRDNGVNSSQLLMLLLSAIANKNATASCSNSYRSIHHDEMEIADLITTRKMVEKQAKRNRKERE